MAWHKPVSEATEWKRMKQRQRCDALSALALRYTDMAVPFLGQDFLCETMQELDAGITISYCDLMKQFDIRMGRVHWKVSTKRLSIDNADAQLRQKLWDIIVPLREQKVILEEVAVQQEKPLLFFNYDGHVHAFFNWEENFSGGTLC